MERKKDQSYWDFWDISKVPSGFVLGCLIGIPTILLAEVIYLNYLDNKARFTLEQKTQNEIVIDSAKIDTTNYQNKDTINYFDYKKQ